MPPLFTVVPLAVPPETRSRSRRCSPWCCWPCRRSDTSSVPPLFTWCRWPRRRRHVLGAAAAHRGAAGRAAGEHELGAAAAHRGAARLCRRRTRTRCRRCSPWCCWPCRRSTTSVPPQLTVVQLAVPPDDTYSMPPLSPWCPGRAAGGHVLSPPPLTVVPLATPPEDDILGAAVVHRGAAGGAAEDVSGHRCSPRCRWPRRRREHVSVPPLAHQWRWSRPPGHVLEAAAVHHGAADRATGRRTISVPPLFTTVLLATPPENTILDAAAAPPSVPTAIPPGHDTRRRRCSPSRRWPCRGVRRPR